MYLTIKQQVKHLSKHDYMALRELCHAAKNLTNQALYNVRQHYFNEKSFLKYEVNYRLLKDSPHYKTLNSNMAQQILKEVDGSFKSFMSLLKLVKQGKYDASKVHIPHYLPKDGFATLVIGFVRLEGDTLLVPFSNRYRKTHTPIKIKVPPVVLGKKIKEIRILPKANARFFEIHYTYEVEPEQRNPDQTKALALDLGVNNLVTAASSEGDTFIIDGRRLKSINQWFNKRNARLQSIKDKQKIKGATHQQARLARKRNNRVNDYLSKACRMIVSYCLEHDIGTLVLGYNDDFQYKSHMGKENNQLFVNIPFGKLRKKLSYLCEYYGIAFQVQEESYTSKASFWDKDEIPVYEKPEPKVDPPTEKPHYEFSGSRVHRGLYKTSTGKCFNADVNGALNILRKCNVVSLDGLYGRGDVNTPIRIRVG